MNLTPFYDLNKSLGILYLELKAVNGLEEYAIFGSSSLAIRGIIDRAPGDIDVFVTRRVWGELLPRSGWFVETPNAGDPPILSLDDKDNWLFIPIHAFYDWSDKACTMYPLQYLERPEIENGLRLVPLEEAKRHKMDALGYGTHKDAIHKADIALIEQWQKEQKVVYMG